MRVSALNLRDFEYVIAVAELGSFIKAAERCHISQPSLSIQVAKLEDRLGTVIFERANRRNVVTLQGQRLIEQMRKVIDEVNTLVALSNVSAVPFGGTLRLSAIATLGPYYFPRLIQGLRLAFPDLALALGEGKTDELITALANGSVDAILVSAPVADSGLESEVLFFEPFLMASPVDAAQALRLARGWAGLEPADRLLLAEGHCLRDQVIAACSRISVSNRRASSLETLKYMVAAGEGCTLVPALAATETAGLVYSAMPGPEYGRHIALAWRRADPRSAELLQIARHLKTCNQPAPAPG